jgi:uncharacterized protein YqeY
MHPKEQLTADLKDAMKSGDSMRKMVIRGALAAFKESEQNKREELVKQALKKHNISRPNVRSNDPEYDQVMAAYGKEVDAAVEAEKVDENIALDESEALALIQRLVKQYQEAQADAEKAGRADTVEAEKQKAAVLQAYLPEQMSREEIEAEARALIDQVGASGPRDMGKVMGPLMGKLQGKADGKLVSEVVRSLLAD